MLNTMTSVTFHPVTPKTNQIVVIPICIHDPSLKLIRQTVLQLSREQKQDRRTEVRTDNRKHNASDTTFGGRRHKNL